MPPPRPLVIPYQGSSRNYSTLPIVPGSMSDLDALTPGLCYAPGENDANINYPEYAMDIAYDVNECQVNTADYWTTQPIQIPLADLRDRPCDLRVTLSPQLPVKRYIADQLILHYFADVLILQQGCLVLSTPCMQHIV